MLHKRLMTGLLAVLMSVSLTGCFDLFGLPNTSVSSNGEWLAFLTGSFEETEDWSLTAVNVETQEQVVFDIEGADEGAFDWHPDGEQLAFFSAISDEESNVEAAGLYLANVASPTEVTTITEDLENVFVTQLAFSPDGTQLAFTALTSPQEGQLATDFGQGEGGEGDPLELDAALYLVNVETGEIRQVTDVERLFPSVLAWSPDSAKIAFTAWNDGNEDGLIDFSGAGLESFPGDTLGVYYYVIADDTVTRVSAESSLGLSPSWLNDNTIIYANLNFFGLSTNDPDALSINSYDISTDTDSTIASGSMLGTGTLAVSASPMGDRIAFVGLGLEEAAGLEGGDEEEPPQPGRIFVMDADGSNVEMVYEIAPPEGSDNDILLDVPVWSNDGSMLFISAGNPFGSLSTLFSGFGESDDVAASIVPVTAVDLANPEEPTVLYEQGILSPGIVQSFATFAIFAGDDLNFE